MCRSFNGPRVWFMKPYYYSLVSRPLDSLFNIVQFLWRAFGKKVHQGAFFTECKSHLNDILFWQRWNDFVSIVTKSLVQFRVLPHQLKQIKSHILGVVPSCWIFVWNQIGWSSHWLHLKLLSAYVFVRWFFASLMEPCIAKTIGSVVRVLGHVY